MVKIIFIPLFIFTFAFDSLFVVSEKNGTIIESTKINPQYNYALHQHQKEYSIQAIYDELHYDENMARMMREARERQVRIEREKALAKKAGLEYHLSKRDRKQLLLDAKYFKGGRYVWGGTTPQGFDCSGYVQYLYQKQNIVLPRTALEQSKRGIEVPMNGLQKGDLVFFLTDKKRGIPITHVGIYLGEGNFIHAASRKQGIIISPLMFGRYAEIFVSARRLMLKS